jgi:CBS domain-containing protein
MTARDCMSSDLKLVAADLSVWSALAIMGAQDVRHLLVVDGDRLVGVLSNRDYRKILEWTRPDGTIKNVHGVTVSRIMTPANRLVTVDPEAPLLDIARLIATRKIGCVPVVAESGRPVGILTQKDVMAALIELLEGANGP